MLTNTTREGELLDYAYLTQIGERRIQDLLDWQWQEFFTYGHVSGWNYIFWFSFE